MEISKLSLPILTVGLIFGGVNPLAAEINWIVRPIVEPETKQISCVGIYQDYSHQLMADKLILFIPGEFDQVQIELIMELGQTSPESILSQRRGFTVTIAEELFQRVIMADQLVIKALKEREIMGEYVINLTGINEATHLLQTETCESGDIYQFPAIYFLMQEEPEVAPMIVPNWNDPKPRGRGTNQHPAIRFPRPSKDGLPNSTGGGGTRVNEEPLNLEEPF